MGHDPGARHLHILHAAGDIALEQDIRVTQPQWTEMWD